VASDAACARIPDPDMPVVDDDRTYSKSRAEGKRLWEEQVARERAEAALVA
jgi:hypothetical protein